MNAKDWRFLTSTLELVTAKAYKMGYADHAAGAEAENVFKLDKATELVLKKEYARFNKKP